MTSRILYTPREAARSRRPFSKKGLFVSCAIAIFFLLVAGASYLIQIPQLQINEIRFSGLEALVKEELTSAIWKQLEGKYIFIFPRRTIVMADTSAIAGGLKKTFPRIKNISVRKIFPHTLEISVEERRAFGILCGRSQCAYIDASGFAYETAPDSTGSLIMKIRSDLDEVKIGSQTFAGTLMELMIFLKEELHRAVDLEVIGYEISQKTPREIRVVTNDGFSILFNREDDFKNVFRVLKTILYEEIKERKSGLEYIDLRFGNKVFYK